LNLNVCSKIESFQHLLNVLLVDKENLLKKVEKGPAISILPRARQTLIRRWLLKDREKNVGTCLDTDDSTVYESKRITRAI
jgi:hypothetical protein